MNILQEVGEVAGQMTIWFPPLGARKLLNILPHQLDPDPAMRRLLPQHIAVDFGTAFHSQRSI
jgi:hypothetical protein